MTKKKIPIEVVFQLLIIIAIGFIAFTSYKTMLYSKDLTTKISNVPDYSMKLFLIDSKLDQIEENTEKNISSQIILKSCIQSAIETNKYNAEGATTVLLYCIGEYLAK